MSEDATPVALPWLLPTGEAAGKDATGRVHKVPKAVPGDVVRIAEGYPVERPSPDRRVPPCAWSDDCGGCDLDRLAPDARHRVLAQMIGRAFRWDATPQVVPSPRSTGHRARIKLAIQGARLGYRRARSHDLVAPDVCAIARHEVQAAHATLRDFVAEHPTEGLASVEIRSDGSRVILAFEGDKVPRAVREGIATLGDVALNGKRVAGDPVLTLTVLGHPLRARPRAFYQVNLEINELLAGHVRDIVRDRGAERLVDLYAGIGNLSVPLAAAGLPVLAVEWPGAGAADLADNAAAQPTLTPLACPVERFDPSREAFDAVVLDPPRAGAKGVLRKLSRNRPRFIIYVSCHAPAAARDLGELRGYRLVDVTCFDLFPDTRHIEAVAVLERG